MLYYFPLMQSLTRLEPVVENRAVETRSNSQIESKLARGLRLAAEVFLILVIVGLLVAIWLPAWVGPHPGVGPH
jgi:hypothetical protein